ncbi:MAG: polymer-forming cytoskeletal protein [Gammaproteobacteria bacterium]|nr:polymer-forming cytoskeletal protein [Gammaproteobacteria bacterium]
MSGSEQISIRKTAEMKGNITSPRVSLEDGARFKGSIEMDPEVSQNVFGKSQAGTNKNAASASAFSGKQSASTAGNSKSQPASAKSDNGGGSVAVSGESAG